MWFALDNNFNFSLGVFYILFASISVWFSGGIMSFNATAYRYITITTPEQQRTIKFVILEIIFVVGNFICWQ